MIWSHIGARMHLLAQNLVLPQELYSPLSVFDGIGLAGLKSRATVFLLAYAALSVFVFYYFSLSLLSVYRSVLWGCGLWTDRCSSLSPCLALPTSFNNNNNHNNKVPNS